MKCAWCHRSTSQGCWCSEACRQKGLASRGRHNREIREHNREIREGVLKAYGQSKCSRCGCSDIRVLDLDHINGGGNKERHIMSAQHLYNYLYRNNFPDKDKYQILCRNCNWIKHCEKLGST